MQLLASLNSHFPIFSYLSGNLNPNPRITRRRTKSSASSTQSSVPLFCAPSPSFDLPPLEEDIHFPDSEEEEEGEEGFGAEERDSDTILEIRRPANDPEVDARQSFLSSKLETGLSNLAKKMPIFEPERIRSVASAEKPLGINLELSLYRAKILGKNFQFKEAEQILRKCIYFWPEDGRIYVALGKLLSKQSKHGEARKVYERGCQATQGENPYIWQCWAVLENKVGNIRRARELFDAATVADKRHIAAWHGWAVLEIRQNNIKKSRNLLRKALKYCKGNEYIYQTLALLENKANRIEQARYLFQKATQCNQKSCASWLAWAQLEMQQENTKVARKLFEKSVQASPKNRFAWHVWAIFEASQNDIPKARKLLKIGHALNPRDPVLLQSFALLEYRQSYANTARVLFRKASELDPKHQPVWMAWGWMEWKEGNINTARELYQQALSIDSTSETAARCLQAWGVLEQRFGNLTIARRLFRSSLNINSQSYITWMTWASMEEEQGNPERAEEIRNLYFQQRTEVVDDASWVMGFLDIIDPAVDNIRKFLNFNNDEQGSAATSKSSSNPFTDNGMGILGSDSSPPFDLDSFIRDILRLDPSKIDGILDDIGSTMTRSLYSGIRKKYIRKVWRPSSKEAALAHL